MPMYDLLCANGHKSERHIPLAEFEAPIVCDCGAAAHRVISAPMFTVDHTGYNCPITGAWIGSRRAHTENLAIHGCRVLETGETEAAASHRRAADAALDKAIENTVEREIDSWSSAKKESLHNELVNGKSDLSLVRQ